MTGYSRFDLGLLHALDALLSEQSVTRAAEKLCVSQPAMSGQLQRLREHFEDELLTRVGRKMELTPRAAALKQPIRELVLSARSTLEADIIFSPQSAHRTFTIIMSDYLGVVLMPALLQQLAKDAPHVQIHVEPLTQDSFHRLESGDADLCVTTDNWKLVDPGNLGGEMSRELLFVDTFQCAVASDHPTIGDTLSVEQYLSAPHIVTRFGQTTGTIEEYMLQRAGLDITIGATAPGFVAPIFMVPGTALLATIQTKLAVKLAPILAIKLFQPPIDIPVLKETMSWHPRNDSDPAHRWLLAFMKDVAAQI